ncbi:MAG: N-acyl-D-amino-acid deacylase family protein [Acidimicrobiia bacterium]
MLDLLISGGTVVDGTNSPARPADVGVRESRIVAVAEPGALDAEGATTTIDATGKLVTPGFVDPHTHYDAQLFWDPLASPSNVHGVTTIINGNCGFTLAPIKARDADYIRRMMAKVEGMPLPALETGVKWDWETFADYLDRLDGNIGVNAGFLVGHCALRRYVMGEESVGNEASPEQLDAMVQLLHASIEAGGLGFSTTLSYTHSDGDGKPVPSRWATHGEVLALCAAVKDHEGTTLEGIVDGCLDQFADDEIDLFVRMSVAGGRPLNWNVLTVDSRVPERVTRQLDASTRAEAAGGRIVALTMPVLVPMNMSFLTYCALFMLPGWNDVMTLPVPERMEKLRDPETRAWMNDRAHSEEAGVFRRLADWGNYVLGDTYSEANEGLKGKIVKHLAAERGTSSFDTLLDIVLNDDLRTILWPIAPDGDAASWELRKVVWEDPRAMLGGSDAGAHLDRMCGAPYTTRFLGDMLRGRKLVSIERAVQMITDTPAQLFGLRDRGRIAEGAYADIVVLDPETVGSEPATLVSDLPGGTARLTADSIGIEHVFVNGVETVTAGESTGALPGSLIRSGRDTATVTP